ncbi:MAG: hypothetical protein ISF22_09490 [Methanomassiliicoccus sp.]|nr:hypothetical protein [Methanomassiliicoccus sp.]
MDKDFRIWVEIAPRKRRCQRCEGDIGKGAMFVRMGNREASRAPCMCASCFEKVMDGLSEEYKGMRELVQPPEENRMEDLVGHGPHCFSCGLPPERCQCAREAYR